jgi:phosphatidylserine decarboxylase
MKTLILAREGLWANLILFALAIGALFASFAIVSALFFLGLIYTLWFFRNPERIPDERDALVFIAPIDGEVANIERADESAKITIKTGAFDSRLIRSPVQAKSISSFVSHGIAGAEGYLSQTEIVTLNGELSVTFLPSFKPSRFYALKNGSYLGERLGFFYGGEAIISLPKNGDVKVAIGAKVRAGETALGFARS